MKSLDDFKKKYKGEWLAFSVTKEKEDGIIEGKVIAHHPDRRTLHQKLRKKRIKGVYITFAGPLVRPGYVVILLNEKET